MNMPNHKATIYTHVAHFDYWLKVTTQTDAPAAWSSGFVSVSATEETGATGCEIESRQGGS
jgi:hypothetical protein